MKTRRQRGRGRNVENRPPGKPSQLDRIEEGLGEVASMVGGADQRAENRSDRELGVALIMRTEDIARFVALQKSNTDGVAANAALITKMVEEIRKAGEASQADMPPEVTAALDAFEANTAALAASTAAGTAAFPADLPIPPVVPVEEPPVTEPTPATPSTGF